MSKFVQVLSGIGILIAIYLFLNNGSKTVQIIESLASNSVKGIKALQGR
jgi:hypothetical protein